jgi:N utilization substance protein A
MILDKNFLNNINAIAKERQLPRDFVIETIVNSIQKAYEKKFPENCLEIKIDLDGGVLEANEIYDVVESDNDDFNDYNQIILEDAQKIIKNAKVGDKIKKAIDFSLLNREIATHILQIFKHGITSESNKQIFKE